MLRRVTQTPYIAGPIIVRHFYAKLGVYIGFANTRQIFMARPSCHPIAAKHTSFSAYMTRHLDNLKASRKSLPL